jgi:zona occludens toxin (predicted ATPase)
MTVSIYTGTPGSGKSLHMSKGIYWRVKHHKPVIANFPINEEIFKDCSSFVYVDNDELTPAFLVDFARGYFADHPFKEGSIRLYIDECQIIFNSRSWNESGRSAWIKFFTQHRKLGYDVVLVAQFDSMVDKQIRSLIEYQYIHRKANNFGGFGFLCNVLFLGHPVVVCVKNWYPLKQRLGADWMLGTKRYYSLYDSYKLFDS